VKIVASFLLAVLSARAADIPRTFFSEDEVEPIHSAIVRKEAWTLDSVRRLRADAEKQVKAGPWSVTTDRPSNLVLDSHDYYSEAPYWWPNPDNPAGPYIRKDGQTNPDRFLANKTALNAMADAVFSLGAAAYFLDEPRYAKRAAIVINRWFVNPATRMDPSLDYAQAVRGVNDGRGAGTIDGRVFIRVVQGLELLAQSGEWDPRQQAAVKKWFEDYLRWLTESRNADDEKHAGNNHSTWWTAQAAAVATFVDNQAAAHAAFDFYRDHIFPAQIRPDGSAPREEARTKSLWYSAFNVEGMTLICRMAQIQGVDLWSIRSRNATIATVVDYLQPYLSDPHKWAKEQIADFSNDGIYFLTFAGMGLKKPEYVALYRKLDHPEGSWYAIVDLITARWEASAHQTRH
jgi:hypothetical protein